MEYVAELRKIHDDKKTSKPRISFRDRIIERYDPREIVREVFEKKVSKLFNLVWADVRSLGHVPDLVSKDRSFFVEVKASSYNNGGVINKKQLYRFYTRVSARRFYAFPYHSITKDMLKDYPMKEDLRKALDLRSLYIFPFSVTRAHFETSKKKTHPKHDDFVQLRESTARKLFANDPEAWKKIGLDASQYQMTKLNERIFLVTRGEYLKQQILDSFRPEEI
jgi:hypothetical protein